MAWDHDTATGQLPDLFVSITDEPGVAYFGSNIGQDGIPQFEVLEPGDYVGGDEPPVALRGVAVASIANGSGTQEVFAAHQADARLYHWNAQLGKMENIADDTGLDTYATLSTAGAWGDFDGDGDVDLFICRAPGYVEDPPEMENTRLWPGSRLVRNDGGVAFVGYGPPGIDDDLSSACAAWCDYDGVYGEDIFVGTFAGSGSHLYKQIANNDFVDATGDLGSNWNRFNVNGCVWAYLNGDDKVDLVVSHFDAPINVFYGLENGVFDESSPTVGSEDGYSGIAVYDYNNDGFPDILGLADDVNRGPDLFENRTAGDDRIFVNVASETGLVGPGGEGTGYVHGVVVADIGNGNGPEHPNPDGFPDLYFGRPVGSGEFLYLSKSSSALPFVKIRLKSQSPGDNAMGIGAYVTLVSGGECRRQFVDGGSMRGGQASSELIFGLKSIDDTPTATVVWPSGTVQPEVPLLLNQVNVIENAPVIVADATVVGTYQIQPGGLTNWAFTWVTNTVGDPAYDRVIFDLPGIPFQCRPPCGSIDNATEDVTLTVDAKQGGGYKHYLVWADRPCIPTCDIGFWVSSGSSAQADTSNVKKSLKVKICTSN